MSAGAKFRAAVQAEKPLQVPVDVSVALSRPAALLSDAATGFATRGSITIARGDWRIPATIALSSSNTGEAPVSPACLTFTAGDWKIPQTVTVTGVVDTVEGGTS